MRKRKKNYDYIVKLLVMGNENVGKRCMIMRFVENRFISNPLETIGI